MRRTPALTAEARRLFLDEVRLEGGWQPGGTIPRIAEATGLTAEQARDAIFAPSADQWRQSMPRMHEGRVVSDEEWDAMQRPVTWQEAFVPITPSAETEAEPAPAEPEPQGEYEEELDKPDHVAGEYDFGAELLAALDAAEPAETPEVVAKRERKTQARKAAIAATQE